GGIIAFTRKLAHELGPFGVTVNAIAPSLTLTERIRPRWAQRTLDEQAQEIARTPLRRVAEAPDQARVICFLASRDADFVTREITLAALEHGKHVLCEARMAMDAAEGRRMLAAARRAPHLVAQLVPAPHTLEVDATLQALLAEGYAGEVLAVELQAAQGRFLDR